MADRSGYLGRAPGDSSVTIARQTNTLTSTQGTFVFNSGYDVGYLDVYINGTKLINATDYQATDGQNVTLTVAGESGDVLEFVAYKAFNLSTVIAEATDLNVSGSFTVDNSAVVESLTAGANISLSGSNGDVTITGLAATDRIVAESLVVSGVSTFQGNLDLDDNDKLLIGTGDDLQIYHDGSNSYIYNSTGELTIANTGSGNTLFITPKVNENSIKAVANGAVELYHDSDKKFETTSSGAQVTGNLNVDGVLTYEDVTNVDSIGIITARSGIVVTGVVTATSFAGDGSGLTGVESWNQQDTWLYGGG